MFTFIFIGLAQWAGAENSFIAAAYNQARTGRFCGGVTGEDLKSLPAGCRSASKPYEAAWETFNRSVFAVAGERQIQKNKCLKERIQKLQSNPEKRDIWTSQAIAAWLGLKKSELMLRRCENEVFSRLETANIKRFGLREAYKRALKADTFAARGEVSDSVLKTCEDESAVSALRSAPALFANSVPVVAATDTMQILEANRSFVINTFTGKPITDAELIDADLRDLSFIKGQITPKLQKLLDTSLNEAIKGRDRLNEKISADILGDREFESDVKDFLVQDDTLIQVMMDNHLVPSTYSSLSNSEGISSSGAYCLLAKHEPTLTGDVLAFVLETAAVGGIILRASRAMGSVKGALSLKQRASFVFTKGSYVTGLLMVGEQVRKSCPGGSSEHKMQKLKDALKVNIISALDLPDELPLERVSLGKEFYCTENEGSAYVVSDPGQNNCALDASLALISLL